MSNEISKKIINDMLDHSIDVIRYAESQKLPRPIVDQIIRSSTSIGANYAEAQDAASKKDFIHKIYTAKKETAETEYWLKFIEKYCGDSTGLQHLHTRTHQFTMILQKIISSSRS